MNPRTTSYENAFKPWHYRSNSLYTQAEGLDFQRTFDHSQTAFRSDWADKARVAVVASVHQVRRSDADQQLEGTPPKGSLVVPGVVKLITIPHTWNMGETVEEPI